MPRPLSNYARLYRLSIAFSPVADLLAGYAITLPPDAGLVIDARLIAACAASVCAFCFGVSLNDYIDRHKDGPLAPSRPIPSGDLTPRAALFASLVMAALALSLAAWVGFDTLAAMTVVLVLAALYNLLSRRSDPLGVINLGAVRAADLFVGTTLITTTAVSWWTWGIAMLLYGLYGTALSVVALAERSQRNLDIRLPAAAAAGIALFPAVKAMAAGQVLPALGLWLVLVFPMGRHFAAADKPAEALVGHLVSGYFLVAALIALASDRIGLCLFLWALYFLSRGLSRWFPPS